MNHREHFVLFMIKNNGTIKLSNNKILQYFHFLFSSFYLYFMKKFTLTANLINIFEEEIYPAYISVEDGIIKKINKISTHRDQSLPYILPGFIDAHVHIESSMLVPSEFARLAVVHGTVATVSDPHEIANVCGEAGVDFMIKNGKEVPFKFFFGAPSCVPATAFETAGATLDATAVEKLLQREDIFYLSEMMNFPGVLHSDKEVMKKIEAAKKINKPMDGHAPGLRGEDAKRYTEAGYKDTVTISTDHECFTKEEALDKLNAGMHILIREGSAARNFEALIDLLNNYPDRIMFCSDDKHPDSLVEGHINLLVKRALGKGISLFNILKAACLNPVLHYHLPVGLLRENDPADFMVIDNVANFSILKTFINGRQVAEEGKTFIQSIPVNLINHFNCSSKTLKDFQIKSAAPVINMIEALDGELITNRLIEKSVIKNGFLFPDIENDILKITVVNRYLDTAPSLAFIKNFGIKNGAIASSVAHDSHNIIAIGTSDGYLCRAVNLLIESKGGICVIGDQKEKVLPLPVAGLMSGKDGYTVAKGYAAMDKMVKETGSRLRAPFMTLSFMALLVIPHLKLSDKGLFDGDKFEFTTLSYSG